MRTVAIVQAHMSSTRLPGKVLMDLGGRTMLERVLLRVRACREVDDVVVAMSTLPADDILVPVCERLGIPVHRGSDTDVLDRFVGAAHARSADLCVRITSDCPLIDPALCDQIIQRFRRADPPVDYASNKIPQSYPRGLDTEVFTGEALERARAEASRPYQRTHVTIYIYENPGRFRLLSVVSEVDRADWRWTVDTAEDLQFVRAVYGHFGNRSLFPWEEIVKLIERNPALRDINRHVVQKPAQNG
jgi:spore coat polysaccharide biosynthesis protein SpsF